MQVTFYAPGLAYSVDSILLFQKEETGDWWRNALYQFYPQLDREWMERASWPEREARLREELSGVYEQLAEKPAAYQLHWNKNRREVKEALGDVFQIPLAGRYRDIRAAVTLNPICPRFLAERRFDVFYRNSPSGALGIALHEIVHFLWFDRWNALFHDDPAEYETPHLKWLFSEMAVKPVLGKPGLAERNPYYPDSCVYDYLETMTAGGRPVMETMEEIYAGGGIDHFMIEGYRYCQEHAAEIRRQMK